MNFSRFIMCFALLILGSGSLFGQVSGIKTIPTDYATIADFITDINTNGIGSGGVTLNVPSGYTETAPAGGFTITATGTAANPIIMQGTGGAPKPIITASGTLTAGALNDGIIKLIGSDYVTISGLDLRENAANTTTAAATNNMTEFGIALFYTTTTDGCQNVSITDNTIALGATYQNAMGIYANSTHNATTMNSGATATTGNNNNLTIKRNTISSVNMGIVVLGPTAAADHASGLVIGGLSGDGNTITFGLNGTFSGFNAVSGTVNGILFRNVKNTNCSFNTLTSNGTVTAGTLNGIQLQAFSNTPTGTFSQVISNNTFNLLSAAVGGNVVGITSPSGSASATSTLDISNNQFNGFGHSVAAPTGNLTFISTASTNFTTTINNNSFNNLTAATTGSVTFVSHSFTIPGGGSSTASNNSIVTQFTKSGAGGSIIGFTTGASSPNSAFYTLSNNNFSNISVTGATSLTFINNTDGSSSACSKTITGNTFSNVTGGTSAIIGFSTSYWGGATSTVANNTFSNISGQSSITAINLSNTFAGTVATSIQNNTISSLSSTGTGSTVTGISIANTATSISVDHNDINTLSSTGASLVNAISVSGATLTNVSANKIYGLSSSNAGGTVYGISITGGTTVNVFNNIISGLTATTASGTDVVRGISVNSSSTSATYGVYYNSVYLNGTSSGTNFGTSGIYHQVSATATTAALDMRNNIIVNETTPVGTGIAVAFRRSGVALNNYASSSNRNLLYAGIPSATRLIMYDATTSYQTILAYQGVVTPRDVNSFSGEAAFTGSGYGTAGNFFISLTGSSSDFLRPVAGITSQIESGAASVPGITTDYTGAVRSGTPDIGAYEFAGTTPAPVITLNSVTPPVSAQCTATARIISVDITTVSGTITGATIGYTVNGVVQTNIVMTNVSGNTWTGTIPVPTPANAVIAWGVAAQNSLGLNSSYAGTAYSDEPLTGVTASVNASSSTICAGSTPVLTAVLAKNGAATIGTATTLTGATVQPTAFCNRWPSYRMQTIYTAAELTAGGLTAGPITSMSFNISTLGDAATNPNFVVKIGTTALTAFTDFVSTTGYTTVFPAATYTHAVGVNVINFSTPYIWDGTSNIVVEVSHDGANATNNAQTYYTATAGNMVAWSTSGSATGTLSTNRLNVTLTGGIVPPIQSISWSDGATTVGTTNPISVTPAATTTYTATITAAGCSVTPAPTTTITVNPLPSAPTAVNSAQCGVQVPTASVTSTSGLPTPTFNWYAASSGGSALQSSTSTTYTSTVGVTTTFYVSELNTTTGCESARTPVTVSVSTPDQVSLTSSAAAICIGGSVTLTASNLNPTPFQNYTYSTVSTAGSGAETPMAGASISVTPTAAGTYTYTVTATDGGCAASATATVLVNDLPALSAATATPATVCSGDNITLSANAISANDGPFVVGAGALTGSTDYYSPFYHNYGGVKEQFVIRASELTAAGLTAGNITSVALNIGTVGTTYAGFTIHMGTTASADLSAGLIPTSSLTQVYSTALLTLTPSSLNTYTLSAPFVWDGTSNLIVQTSWSNNNTGGSSSEVSYDNTAYVSTAYYRVDSQTPATVLAATTASSTRSSRPKMTFGMNHNNSYTWSWSPGTGLNTPTATTSVTNTSGSATTQAFTVTATNTMSGCVATATTPLVTINSATAAPVANNSTQCGIMTPTASVTGTGTPGNTFSWYLVPTGGTAIAGQTGSSLSGYPVSATTTFYVTENNGTCSSARTAVTVTVTTPPAISIAGTTTICNGSSTSLTVTSPNDPNYTYTWTGGLGTGATVTASPTVTTSYTVTATDASGGANNGCITTATTSIIVNPAPLSSPITPATAVVCNGVVQQLTVGGSAGGTAVLGNGTTAPGTTSFPNPLSAYYGGTKHQILFTAAELTAQGMVAGSKINSVAFDLNTFAANACTNFTIRMGNTALTALTGFVGGTTTVYGPTTFTPSAAGLVTFTLVTPYTWDGTSNIVVETVHNAGNGGNGSGTRTNTTTTATNTVFYGSTDNVAGGIAGYDALSTWGTSGASNLRPNMRFVYTNLQPTWAPMSSLYTNAGGTVAYTGATTGTVYAKPSATTTYVATYTAPNGCTAQSTATITVNQPSSSTVLATACGTYTWAQNGATYTTSGVHTATIPNAAGCDSVITLNLTINSPSASSVSVAACDTYTWAQNGMTYVTSGAYHDTVANAVGCDSVITLNLTINHLTTATVNQVACQTYTWPINGTTYTTSGTHTATIPNAAGCDSVVTLNLTIGGPSASLVPVTACSSYTWAQNGMTYNTSGAYNDTIPNMFGCDSVVTLSLTINQPTSATVIESGCASFTWAQNGMTYTTSGMYTDTIPNAAGCDSVITLNLTILQPTTSSVSAIACTSYTWAQNGLTYTASGAYTDTIPNAVGCDSIITLNLTISQPTVATVTVSTCNPYTWAQTGITYTASGMYNDTITNAAGCDSVVTLNLTIAPFVATATDNGNATATASAGTTYQWINCTTNSPIAGATAQTFVATANGTYAAIVSNGTCSDTTNCVTIANVGIKESVISTISVHPNPTHDYVIVTMDASSATVEVMDVQGKLIQATQIKSGDQVDLSTYERGVYTLRIKTEFGTSLERIVKN
nr:T9SS type A sorting domain-containing protein [uncultured Fluviicola sp.]